MKSFSMLVKKLAVMNLLDDLEKVREGDAIDVSYGPNLTVIVRKTIPPGKAFNKRTVIEIYEGPALEEESTELLKRLTAAKKGEK